MSDDALTRVLDHLHLRAGLFTEAAYCGGSWAVDTSGQRMSTFHLIQAGDCWLSTSDGEARRLQAGDFVLFPRDAKHLISAVEHPDADTPINAPPGPLTEEPVTEMLCGYFEFEGSNAWPLLETLPDALVLDLASNPLGEARGLLNLLISEAMAERPGREAVINQLVLVLFVHCLRSYLAEGDGPSEGLLAAYADPKVGRALNAFHADPGAPWNVAGLAAAAGMSRVSFSNHFRQLTGQTPMHYVSGWRMELATTRLTGTDESMASIAEAVGYESEAAFRNAFKQRTGQPPGQVRRAARAQPPAP